ncbi:MAG: hypothetical protein M1821_001233 [Bathelium mastoideum]|nr:MAG: hypothetical protein M1821_001233 [Bathelium mastoideum]
MTLFLDLPPEILQLILEWLDPNSVFLASLVCKTLRSSIFSVKSALHCHLNAVPGCPTDPNSLTIQEAGRLYNVKLQASLLRGVNILADRRCYQFVRRPKAKIGLLQPCECASNHTILILVDPADDTIHIYYTAGEQLIHSYCLKTSLLADCVGVEDPRDMNLQVLSIALNLPSGGESRCKGATSKLFVLYRYSISGGSQNSFIRLAADKAKEVLKLVKYDGRHISGIQDIAISVGDQVLGLAFHGRRDVAIILKDANNTQWLQQVELSELNNQTAVQNSAKESTLIESAGDPDENLFGGTITDMYIRDKKLYVHTGLPVPERRMKLAAPSPQFKNMDKDVSEGDTQLARYNCGAAFATRHRCGCKVEDYDQEVCVNTSLFVGFRAGEPREAFLVKGVQTIEYHRNISVGSFDSYDERKVVAKLCGYDATMQTSIGPILAISLQGTRVAIAFWDRVLVWAIEPEAFLNPSVGTPSVDVDVRDEAGDVGYLTGCGATFYRKFQSSSGLIYILPVELDNLTVVYKLAFTGEDILFGLTSHGVISWDMRPGCARRRIMDYSLLP